MANSIPLIHRAFARYASTPDHPCKIRILRYLRKIFRLESVIADTQFGRLKLGLDDHVQSQILLEGGYELHSLKFISERLKPGDCFLDIGANVGQYTLAAASRVGINGRVVAVEPNPAICADLIYNVSLNNFPARIDVLLAAANASDAILGFDMPPADNRGMSRESLNVGQHAFLVCGVPLDRLLAHLEVTKVDFVKIDVEGSELRALNGLLNSQKYFPSNILFEFLPDHFRYGDVPQDLLRFLEGHNYEILQITGEPYRFGDSITEENLWARRNL